MDVKKSKWRMFVEVYTLYKPFRGAFLAALSITLVFQLIGLGIPFIIGRIIDGFNSNAPTATLVTWAALILGLELLELPVTLLSHYINVHKLDYKLTKHLNNYTFERVTSLSLGQITSEHSGFRQSAIDEGMSAITNVVSVCTTQILPMLIKMVVILIAMIMLNWMVGGIALLAIFLFVLSSILINSSLLPSLRIIKKKSKLVNQRYSDAMRNLPLVIVNGEENRVKGELEGQYVDYTKACTTTWDKYVFLVLPWREPTIRFGLFAIILMTIYLMKKGELTTGQLATLLSWSMILFSNIGNIGNMQRQIMRLSTHISQYFEILNTPCDLKVSANPKKLINPKGRIEFRKVSFAYKSNDDGQGALHDLSFTVLPGETCAIVGHSGSGKTTSIKHILRANDPDEGEVLIDGINLIDIDLASWRRHVGYVEQNVPLWDNTLAYNMTFGANGYAEDFDEARLHELAQMTCIDRFYDRLGTTRFKTRLGENGIMLSGGERQRVGIARALAKNPCVLILDEATNSLDTVNEALVQTAIRKAAQGRTTIIIAHRLSTVRHANKIIVLDKGRKVGEGKHDDLLKSCPEYRALVENDMSRSM